MSGPEHATRQPHPSAEALESPASIGRYVVVDELGRGGMGVVLRAYDPKLRREVALKRLHTDRSDPRAAERLLREARALAQLSHPNVVSVFDVELIEHDVVLSMEYVGGCTLGRWSTADRRSWPEIVDVFCRAGRGLAAAHEHGLLHRDFKPSNVLIAVRGGQRRVKVVDFGLARAVQPRIDEPSGDDAPGVSESERLRRSEAMRSVDAITESGSVLGSPPFMAPEQHRGDALTPAADQYAFCVALWQALTGALPFPVQGRSNDAVWLAKREGPPTWPATILVPRALVAALRRGLAPEPGDRWPSLGRLLDRLEAIPRRRRRASAIALGFGIVVTTAGAVAWYGERSALCSGAAEALADTWNEQRRAAIAAAFARAPAPYAEDLRQHVEAQLEGYAAQWIATRSDACEATTLRRVQAPAIMDLRIECLRHAAVDLESVVVALSRADAATIERAHTLTASLPDLERCSDPRTLAGETPMPRDRADREAIERMQTRVAEIRTGFHIGRYERALAEAQAIGPEVEATGHLPLQADWGLLLGQLLDARGEYPESERALRGAFERALAGGMRDLAAQAAAESTFAVGYRQRRYGAGLAYGAIALGLAEPRTEVLVRSNMASVLYARGDLDLAEAQHRLAIAVYEATGPRDPLMIASMWNNLATVMADRGRVDEAEAAHRSALDTGRRLLGAEHPMVAKWQGDLAGSLYARGDLEGAEAAYREASQRLQAALGGGHPSVLETLNNLGYVRQERGDYDGAADAYRRALTGLDGAAADDPLIGVLHSNLGGCLLEIGQVDEARSHLGESLRVFERTLPADHAWTSFAYRRLGQLAELEGRPGDAVSWLERAWTVVADDPTDPRHRRAVALALARLVCDRDPRRARALVVSAVDGSGEETAELAAWLRARAPNCDALPNRIQPPR